MNGPFSFIITNVAQGLHDPVEAGRGGLLLCLQSAASGRLPNIRLEESENAEPFGEGTGKRPQLGAHPGFRQESLNNRI